MIPRVSLGQQPDGTYGLRVSLPNINVLAADPNNSNHLSFNSDWPDILRTHMIGQATIQLYPNLTVTPIDRKSVV